MDKVFHIRAFCSPNGTFREVELDLPATDYELLDAMEQLQPEDGKRPYLEFRAVEEYNYLDKRIQETDLFRLNALAKRLAELDNRGMAAFEGLVCMDLQKGEKAIPISSLIDYAHSGDCCHVVEDVVTDEELGRFLVENGFIPEAEDLSDEALKLLDYTRIGKEHREAEGSAFTGFGYVERHSELPRVYETMDFRSCKPPYTVLLNIGPFPNVTTPGSRPKPIPVQLPTSDEELQDILARLGKPDWNGVMSAILDCSVPSMNKRLFLEDDIPQVIEWAKALQTLDKEGSLPKYKALLNAENCEDLSKAVSLIDELDQYTFCPEYGSVSEVAKGQLHLILGEREAKMLLPHLDLNGYGKDLIQYLGGAVTPYGFLEKRESAPMISEENQPQRGGMEMM